MTKISKKIVYSLPLVTINGEAVHRETAACRRKDEIWSNET